MLTIRSAQLKSLDDHATRKFAGEIRPALAKKYPQCLSLFPEKVQDRIVLNMLSRAGHWGLTWQTSLLAFAEMMLSLAPNFDDLHEVRAMLRLEWLVPNRAVFCINPQMTRDAWKAARIPAQDLPLFVGPEWIGAPLLEQTIAALPVALGDKLSGADPRCLAETAWSVAKSLALEGIPDAGLVIAAWQLLYGSRFQDQATHPWLADVFGKKRRPAEVVSLLKLRLRLDHGRYI